MLATAVLAAVLAAAPVPAKPAPAAKELPLAAQVAREVLTPELWEKTLDEVVPQVGGQIRGMVAEAGGTVDDGLEAAIRKIYDDTISYEYVADLQASMLEKHFTQPELAELRAFYRTPLGRKMRDVLPSLTADVTAAAMEKIQAVAAESFGALAPLIHVPEPGGAAPVPARAP